MRPSREGGAGGWQLGQMPLGGSSLEQRGHRGIYRPVDSGRARSRRLRNRWEHTARLESSGATAPQPTSEDSTGRNMLWRAHEPI